MSNVLKEIKKERKRQDAKWGEQNHRMVPPDMKEEQKALYIGLSDHLRETCDKAFAEGTGSWQDILAEEVAEAFAEAVQGNKKAFREELVQVGAVVVAMIECVDRNGL